MDRQAPLHNVGKPHSVRANLRDTRKLYRVLFRVQQDSDSRVVAHRLSIDRYLCPIQVLSILSIEYTLTLNAIEIHLLQWLNLRESSSRRLLRERLCEGRVRSRVTLV